MKPDIASYLAKGRDAYERRAWDDAFRLLARADAGGVLEAADLELLAMAAALTDRTEALIAALERVYRIGIEAEQPETAARAAFWIGFRLFSIGEAGRATGWVQRAQRSCERAGEDCAVAGYILLPAGHQAIMAGTLDVAGEHAIAAARIGERFAEPDLVSLALTLQGRIRVLEGDVAAGLALLDEAMLPASDDELSPLVAGLVYCSVIAICHQVYALDRAREWTSALADWCDAQPQLVAFSGTCLVHRAEIMQINGDWQNAIAEARRAADTLDEIIDRSAAGAARYQQAEIHRLRGQVKAAEKAYRAASQLGHDPQPGLALLRLSQNRPDQAASAIRRALTATAQPLGRARLLPAYIEIMLETGATDEAVAASGELGAMAREYDSDVLTAMAAQARGAIMLSRGEAGEALGPLRDSFAAWHRLGAPYLAARVRVSLARCCAAVGDADSAAMEQEAARAVFAELGAAPDLAALGGPEKADAPCDLTRRELEVLRLLATGKTNRSIAQELGVSAKTIDRHVTNIFNKLDVSSRAAATALAYRESLV